jgi:hypothetical protein
MSLNKDQDLMGFLAYGLYLQNFNISSDPALFSVTGNHRNRLLIKNNVP